MEKLLEQKSLMISSLNHQLLPEISYAPFIRDGIDMYFRYKAANIKIDDHVCLDNYLNRKY